MNKKCLIVSAGMILFLAIRLPASEGAQATYQVDLTVGTVEVSLDRGGNWKPADLDQDLPESAVVRTAKASSCDISLPVGKGSFRLMENSELELLTLGASSRFKVRRGFSLFDIFKPLLGGESVEVETDTGVASVRGTQFFVDSRDGSATISVEEGTVQVRRNISFDLDQDLSPDFDNAIRMTVTSGQQVDFTRADNERFLAGVRKFRSDRASLRKYLDDERRNALKRVRALKNRDRLRSLIQRKRSDDQTVRRRKAQALKKQVPIRKRKADLNNIKKKMRLKRAAVNRQRVIQYLRRRR